MSNSLIKNHDLDYIQYYQNNRNKYEDLYPSEKEMLSIIDLKNKKILDVGCACGGFYSILKGITEEIDYYGIDLDENLINLAKKIHNDNGNFTVSDGNKIDFPDNYFDLVICNSVQAHNPNYENLFLECWRVTKQHLMFDFRMSLTEKSSNISILNNYFVLNVNDIYSLIKKINNLKQFKSYCYEIFPNKNNLNEEVILNNPKTWCNYVLFEKH